MDSGYNFKMAQEQPLGFLELKWSPKAWVGKDPTASKSTASSEGSIAVTDTDHH